MSEPSEIQQRDKCDYDRCHCVPDPGTAVADGKSVFCSPGCAEGIGCEHEPCGCRSAPPPRD